MLYRKIVAVCSQIRTKHTNTPWSTSKGFYENPWDSRANKKNLKISWRLSLNISSAPACTRHSRHIRNKNQQNYVSFVPPVLDIWCSAELYWHLSASHKSLYLVTAIDWYTNVYNLVTWTEQVSVAATGWFSPLEASVQEVVKKANCSLFSAF